MTSYIPDSIAPADPFIEKILAVRGYCGYRQYRIPALAVTVRGTLVAAYDGRPNLDDLPSPIDLLVRRSLDNGQTWDSQQQVRTGSGLNGYGDPSLLVDAETGRIFLFHAAGTRAGFFESTTGLSPNDEYVQHCDLSFSDDDGATWQDRRITDQLKGSSCASREITGIFAAAGQGIQIHAGEYQGRLVQQFVVLRSGKIMAASAYSDDHGDNWTLGELINAAPGNAAPNENKVAALADGRLLLHSRATPRRLAGFSNDGGHSWGNLLPVEDLPDPSDNGSLVRFDGLPAVQNLASELTDNWLLATNNHDTDLRRNTVLSLSPDNGETWPAKLVLCSGSSAYSTVTRLSNGNIGVLYERQGYREIVFVSIPPTQLIDQLLERKPSVHNDAARAEGPRFSFDMELRSITPGLPKIWQNAGDSHVLATDGSLWDTGAWKEIGQGYSPDQVQILGTREAQDLNYGPVLPGYKAGDIIAFTGRARTDSTDVAHGVTLTGPDSETFPKVDLSPSEQALYFTPTYTVAEKDVNQASFEITYTIEATLSGSPLQLSRTFRFDVARGNITIVDTHSPLLNG